MHQFTVRAQVPVPCSVPLKFLFHQTMSQPHGCAGPQSVMAVWPTLAPPPGSGTKDTRKAHLLNCLLALPALTESDNLGLSSLPFTGCIALERVLERPRVLVSLAGEDCLWYLDRNGSWHPGFNCEFFTFCCGTCYQRYCCRDLTLLITERQQKHCLAFSPKTIAGIASAVILFVAVVATTICCFLCSCCYLYRRRQQLQSPFEGQEIPMTGIPVQPMYPYPQDPKAGPAPPQPGFMYPPSGPAPQYPLYPAGPPIYNPAAPPPYMPPQPSYPGA
ncbi:Protein shisa-4 [Tupaia chinensis]|uniref:Protein shisa-4 n=1 Tax=Tupaia chinensis TaxID=246437 RepID=L9JFA8_TUPCH|nr:Protein shisa-4 [Tupaia chinensis]